MEPNNIQPTKFVSQISQKGASTAGDVIICEPLIRSGSDMPLWLLVATCSHYSIRQCLAFRKLTCATFFYISKTLICHFSTN